MTSEGPKTQDEDPPGWPNPGTVRLIERTAQLARKHATLTTEFAEILDEFAKNLKSSLERDRNSNQR
jgi:hypothetical protein